MFFSSTAVGGGGDPYGLLKDAARFADAHGLAAIWTPERHFHPFGGLYPNPALTTCALAMITSRVQLRAGSLVAPLHDPLRIAEDWSVADNLSRGRVAVSFGSGWNAADFVICPERYAGRRDLLYEYVDIVQRLWRGDPVTRVDPFGNPIDVYLHPRPVQAALPVWITASGSPATFARAGAVGANVLTHLLGQDVGRLAAQIAIYRDARRDHGFDPATGTVSVMLHTFVGEDEHTVREIVRGPLRDYLRSAASLERSAAGTGGTISGGKRLARDGPDPDNDDEMLDLAFERYFHTAALIGTPDRCHDRLLALEDIGVDEVACLIDFGVDPADTLASLGYVADFAHVFRDKFV